MSGNPRALIVVAAGASRRMAGIDKVWATLGGRPVIWHALHALTQHVDFTVLVVHESSFSRARDLAAEYAQILVVSGGADRQESVRLGLASLPANAETVAVHDGARPFASPDLLQDGFTALLDAHGAVPVLPVTDTIKRVDDSGKVLETIGRESLRSAQTPQVFQAAALREAHNAATRAGRFATDDAALLEAIGHHVVTFPGDPRNFKITTGSDLLLARTILG